MMTLLFWLIHVDYEDEEHLPNDYYPIVVMLEYVLPNQMIQ